MTTTHADDLLISSINQKLLKAYKAEEEFWKQRSRKLWLTLGDRNTCFFHASNKSRRACNRLTAIEDVEGNPVYEDNQTTAVISDYFQEIFNSSSPSATEVVNRAIIPCISTSTNDKLTAIPSILEVKEALFGIHPDKAPGPDGFSARFFQSNWSAVGPGMTKEIQYFFSTGTLPYSINSTHIRLIPKIQSPKQVTDYLPIALCNVYYKVISKLLSLHINPVLKDIISETQSAFTPDRAISDNVLITHEMLHYLKTSKAMVHCSMTVKTYISKALIGWNGLLSELFMEKMGFSLT